MRNICIAFITYNFLDFCWVGITSISFAWIAYRQVSVITSYTETAPSTLIVIKGWLYGGLYFTNYTSIACMIRVWEMCTASLLMKDWLTIAKRLNDATWFFGASQGSFFLGLALFLPLPRWENSRTSGNSRQGRAVVGVVSFFASHKYVASHCVFKTRRYDELPVTQAWYP